MADEIRISLKMNVDNGYIRYREDVQSLLVTMNGTVSVGGIQKIGTSPEALAMTDVTAAGYCMMQNVSTANYIEIGTGAGTSFAAFAKLKYGESALFRLGTSAPYAKANTAESNLKYVILAD